MENWHGHHPIPWDYFYAMSAGAGKKLDWFFYNWFYTTSWIDLAIDKTPREVKGGYDLSIANIGGFAVPFDVIMTYTDGTKATFHQTPAVWEANTKATIVHIPTPNALKSVTIDGGIFMDANVKDNTWPAAAVK